MRYVFPCLEQLDRAAIELRDSNPVSARLALILTDNVVELIAHRRCKDIFALDSLHRYDTPPKHAFKTRREVLGQHFDKKLSFLRAEGDLVEDEYTLALQAHRYRNEAYHVGVVHEQIIHPVAWHYHELACDLFARLRPSSFSSTGTAQIPPAVRRHAKKLGLKDRMLMIVNLDQAAASLSEERPTLNRGLQVTLVSTALSQIDEVEHNIRFVLSNAPTQLSPEQALRDALYWKVLSDALSEVDVPRNSKEYAREFQRVRAGLATWKPSHREVPLRSWRQRASRIGSKHSVGTALANYEMLRRDMAEISEAVEAHAAALDSHIQSQIDHARGK